MPSSSNSSTYFRQEIMKGTLPGPWKARLVMRGKTSPVEIGEVGNRADFLASGIHNGLPQHLGQIEHGAPLRV